MYGSIGHKIRHLRIHKGLSQRELISGMCSVAYLSKVENGKAKPSKAFVQQIAERLQVNVAVIDSSISDDFVRRVEEVLIRVEHTSGKLTVEDEGLLNMVLIEFVPQQMVIRVITVLFKHYLLNASLQDAEMLYEAASKLIDLDTIQLDEHMTLYFHLHNVLGKYFYMKENFTQADHHFLRAERCIDTTNHSESAKIYYNISVVKQRLLEDKSIAIFYSEKAYELFMKENDIDNVIHTLITLGVQYHFAKQFDRSLHVLQEAEQYIEESASENKKTNEMMIKYNIGRVYQSLKRFDEAITYYDECLQQHIAPTYKAHILKSLVEIQMELKQWDYVKTLLAEALALTTTHHIFSIEIELYCIKADVFKARGDDESYELHLKKAMELAEQHEYFLFVKRIAKQLGSYYYDQRFYKKAAMYYAKALAHA